MPTPRVAAIHDISGFGRCSMTIIMPALSVMGVQCCPLPTAYLSTHTGGFEGNTFLDLTDQMERAAAHWRELGLRFDAVYTGFMGSCGQAALAADCIRTFKRQENLAVVDPVMGDHGKLYRAFTREMVEGIGRMARKAQVITPNLTEAAILLGEAPAAGALSTAAARSMLARLGELGPEKVVVTGVTLATGEYVNLCYDREHNSFWKSVGDYIPVHYPGTGDIFAAVLTASLLQGDSLPLAMDRAARYVELTIKTTYSYSTDPREGVMLERTLEWLTRKEVSKRFQSL